MILLTPPPRDKDVQDRGAFLMLLFVEIYVFLNTYRNPTRKKEELIYKMFYIHPAPKGLWVKILENLMLSKSKNISGILFIY